MKDAMDGSNFFSHLVGTVSSSHDFVDIEFIILITSLVESASKYLNVPPVSAIGSHKGWSYRVSHIFCILVMKYSANSSASTSGTLLSGSRFSFWLLIIY